jgi:hypothetical protein
MLAAGVHYPLGALRLSFGLSRLWGLDVAQVGEIDPVIIGVKEHWCANPRSGWGSAAARPHRIMSKLRSAASGVRDAEVPACHARGGGNQDRLLQFRERHRCVMRLESERT